MTAPLQGKVYFATCHAPDGYDMKVVKIGCAADPEKRVKMVQTGQPFDCRLVTSMPGDLFMEYFVHMWLRQERISGEFFHMRGRAVELIDYVSRHRRHPFPLKNTGPERSFRTLDVVQFMDRHGISLADVKKAAGITCNGYEALLKKEKCGNRRFLAALCVTAVKRGVSIAWPRDFQAADPAEQVAA